MLRRISALGALLLCCACGNGIQITKTTPDAGGTGVPWALAFTQYEITVTRSLVDCGNEPKLATKAALKAGKALDPSQFYLLSAKGDFDVTDIKAQYDTDGTATTLNASSEDRTAAVVSNVVGGVAKLVALGAGAAAGKNAPPSEVCSPEAKAALARIPGEQKKVETATNLLAIRNDALSKLTAKNDGSAQGKKALAAAQAQEQNAADKLAEAQQVLDDDNGKISSKVTLKWPLRGDSFQSPCDAIVPGCGLPQPCPAANPACAGAPAPFVSTVSLTKAAKAKLAVYFQLVPAIPGWKGGTSGDDNPPGVPVRFAAPGRMLVCLGAPCGPNVTPIQQSLDPVLQLGAMTYLPAPHGAFNNGSVAVEMNDGGAPKTLQTTGKSAAETASAMFKDTATQANDIAGTLNGAATARLKAKTDALKAQKDYDDAKAALGPNAVQLQDLKTQADLLNAQAQLRQAQAADALASQALQQ